MNYETLHKQALDTTGHDYRAPFNTIASLANVATPEDKFVITPNSDTPYSFLWMDLRTEPIVVTMPKVEKARYYSGQLIDLYTFNFAYLGNQLARRRAPPSSGCSAIPTRSYFSACPMVAR